MAAVAQDNQVPDHDHALIRKAVAAGGYHNISVCLVSPSSAGLPVFAVIHKNDIRTQRRPLRFCDAFRPSGRSRCGSRERRGGHGRP